MKRNFSHLLKIYIYLYKDSQDYWVQAKKDQDAAVVEITWQSHKYPLFFNPTHCSMSMKYCSSALGHPRAEDTRMTVGTYGQMKS